MAHSTGIRVAQAMDVMARTIARACVLTLALFLPAALGAQEGVRLRSQAPPSAGLASRATSERSRPDRPRVSVDRFLAGREIAESFEALEPLLEGYEVVVTDDAGRARRGRVVSVSRDRLLLASPVAASVWEGVLPLYPPIDFGVFLKRRLFPAEPREFAASSVTRIDIVDPAGNGAAIGAAVGAGFMAGVYLWERQLPDSSLKGVATALAILIGLPVGLRMGHVIDRAINKPIYLREPRRTRVTVAPLFDQTTKGIIAQVRF